jgi:predicted transcriptional regulator of viral defense system
MNQLPILFSHNDILDLYPTMSSFSSFVFRSAKRGSVKQIKRGLYALVDPSTGNIYATPFQIASRLFADSYFSYHEALEYYGLANQSFVSGFTYLAHTYTKDFDFNGVTYKAKKSTCNLQILDRMKEEGVRVVSLERAVVDSIDCPSLSGGLEEIEYALDNSPELDIRLVEQLLEHYNKNVLYQKVGYLFEKHYGGKIPPEFYAKCLKHVGNKIVYFESRVGQAKLNIKWRLMIENRGGLPDELF